MALLTFKKPEAPAARAPDPAPATTAILAPASQPDAKRHAADDVPDNFPGSYAPPARPVVAPEPRGAELPSDMDPRVANLRQSLLSLIRAVAVVDPLSFHCPDLGDIAKAQPSQLVQWARDIARNLKLDGGASC